MKTTFFGIEIEMSGLTRATAASTVAELLNGTVTKANDHYDTYKVTDRQDRVWKLMSDASITCQKKVDGRMVPASREYSVELVSPKLTYENDIDTLQEIVRRLRKAGAVTSGTEGIHIHLDGSNHTPRSIKNFVNIIASKNDLFYKALEIEPSRARYCQKIDSDLVEKIKAKKPTTFQQLEEIWYAGYSGNRTTHYHESRYCFLNLHSFFYGVGTVELRGFNSTLHAGKIRSYIILALALNQQALTQKCASAKKNQTENEKFAMRTYLNRIGFIGDEFKNCREHLTAALSGSAAWRFRTAA